MKITPVILAGGAGERLWPLSKLDYPKQFVTFPTAAHSLFQEAILRCGDRARFNAPIILGNAAHRFILGEQLRAIGREDAIVIAEPFARNTAPALALAALHAGPDALLLVSPSDHRITDESAFFRAVDAGIAAAQQGEIVTFAVTATKPESGYGYIERGDALAFPGVHRIARFIEKPEREIAAALIATGNVGINSGIFLLSSATALELLGRHAPTVLASCRTAYQAAVHDGGILYPNAATLEDCLSISIDYAIMEHTDRGAVIPVAMGWSDLGSFTALAALSARDTEGNACSGNVVTDDARDCYLYSDGPLVAAYGVRDLVVVAADNAVLITHRDRTQDIKPLLQQLRAREAPDLQLTSSAHRPWGKFYRIDQGSSYQVKRLHLKPGAMISLQSHQYRSEHWIVIEGIATVTKGDQTHRLGPNHSTYIPAGEIHRLENREAVELVVIEVQTGDYLGEDDIARFEDMYHRK